MRKGFAAILIVAIVAAILGTGGILAYQKLFQKP